MPGMALEAGAVELGLQGSRSNFLPVATSAQRGATPDRAPGGSGVCRADIII